MLTFWQCTFISLIIDRWRQHFFCNVLQYLWYHLWILLILHFHAHVSKYFHYETRQKYTYKFVLTCEHQIVLIASTVLGFHLYCVLSYSHWDQINITGVEVSFHFTCVQRYLFITIPHKLHNNFSDGSDASFSSPMSNLMTVAYSARCDGDEQGTSTFSACVVASSTSFRNSKYFYTVTPRILFLSIWCHAQIIVFFTVLTLQFLCYL